jgi:hypothetical protein
MSRCSGQIASHRQLPVAAFLTALLLSASLNIYADTPSFNSPVNYPVGAGSISLAAYDLDGDGIQDLVIANTRGNAV